MLLLSEYCIPSLLTLGQCLFLVHQKNKQNRFIWPLAFIRKIWNESKIRNYCFWKVQRTRKVLYFYFRAHPDANIFHIALNQIKTNNCKAWYGGVQCWRVLPGHRSSLDKSHVQLKIKHPQLILLLCRKTLHHWYQQ